MTENAMAIARFREVAVGVSHKRGCRKHLESPEPEGRKPPQREVIRPFP